MASLFNRPAWAKAHNTADDEGEEVNIFSHSSSFKDIVAEQERRRREKLERKKVKAERRSSGKHKREKDEDHDNVAKKRRITMEDGEALLSRVGLPANAASDHDDSENEAAEPVRRSPRKNKHQRNGDLGTQLKSSSRAPHIVEINDASDDDDEPEVQFVRSAEPDEDAESDEEFAELRRRARLQRQQRENNSRHSGTSDTNAYSNGVDTQDARRYRPAPPEDDPVVQLLITSPIPNTNQLIVQRKLSQRLEEVRKAWCNKQGFQPEFTARVFFIHRMVRLYDVTTCKSLGLEIDAFGELTMKGAEGKEGVEKVHLQAVTEEIHAELKAAKKAETRKRSGELAAGEQAGAGAEEVEESYIRVSLVAKDKEILRLKVKPSTRFSKIAAAYSKQRLDGLQNVRLEFDHEPLDLDDMVQNSELSDEDSIDVYPI